MKDELTQRYKTVKEEEKRLRMRLDRMTKELEKTYNNESVRLDF